MKMLIKNKTDLTYQEIGRFIDSLIRNSREETLYYGKKDRIIVAYKGEEYKVTIEYKKRYVVYLFEEVIDKEREEQVNG